MKNVLSMMCKGVCASLFFVSFIQATPDPAVSCTDVMFPGGTESCRDYWGDNWDPAVADADCGNIPGSTGGTLQVGTFCDTTDIVGTCVVDGGTLDETRLYFYNGPADLLEGNCVNNMNGEWLASLPTGSCDHLAVAGPPGTPGVPACKQYSGANWDETNSPSDCSALDTSVFNAAANCQASSIGYCTVGQGTADEYSIHYYAGDAATYQAGCEGFLQGVWTDAAHQETILPEAVDALVSDSVMTVIPDSCDDATVADLAANNSAIEFIPTAGYTKGLIIYPGGAVDPRAYAVAARKIAEHGIFVAIVPFPGNIAITDPMRANYILMAHPEITEWAIAGHSLGGITAAIYAQANPFQKIKGIAFWDAYVPEGVDLSQTPLKGVYLEATERCATGEEPGNCDPYANERIEAIDRLPQATYQVTLRGANHGQFGYYGDHEGDGEAKISREHQHDLFAGATVHLMNRLGISVEEDVLNENYAMMTDITDRVCKKAQVITAGLRFRDLKVWEISNTTYEMQSDMQSAKPSFPADGSAKVDVATYAHQIANPTDIHAAPVYNGEVWCKMKSQAAFVEQYGVTPRRAQGSCAEANFAISVYAMTQVDPTTLIRFMFSGNYIQYEEDFMATSGPEWLSNNVVVTDLGNGAHTVKASNLTVPTVVPAPFGGNLYCKIWSPEQAVKFIINHTD